MPKQTTRYYRFVFSAAIALMVALPAAAQNQQANQQEQKQDQKKQEKKLGGPNGVELRGSGPKLRPDATNTIRVDVPLVLLNVTVTDPYGRVVTGLEREHFRVLEDKQAQEITHFSSEDVPISIGVIIDVSGSMSNKYDKARQAAVRFMRTANPQDEFLLVSFSERAQLVSHFTGDIETLQSRLLYTKPPQGRTALLDAVYLALSQMHGAQHSRKALLIISDGADNHSRYNQRDIKRAVEESEVQIYAIGIYDPWSYRHSPEERWGPALLGEITEITGGRSFTVENLNDLPDIATKISLELRNQYTIGFRPANREKDGKWRKLKVKLDPPRGLPDLHTYARTGYYAPKP